MDIKWHEENHVNLLKDYAVCMLILQDKAGLSYKEARAVMSQGWETDKNIIEDYGISHQAIYNLYRRGLAKIDKTGMTQEQLCEGYNLPLVLID
jgi:lambda repressor-like predicted transcriptional regulator